MCFSQRISFVHRFLEDGVADGERLLQLQRLLANLPTDLTHNRQQIPASVWLNSLQTLASAVKLDLQIEGQLPTDEHKAHLFYGFCEKLLRMSLFIRPQPKCR